MAKSHNNFKPRRSRRSGLKKAALIKKNIEVLKKLSVGVLLLFMMACTTTRYVYVDPKDSVVKRQRVVYDNYIAPSPFYDPFFRPYFWGPRPIIVVPRNQPQRPGFGPLPPTPKPRR